MGIMGIFLAMGDAGFISSTAGLPTAKLHDDVTMNIKIGEEGFVKGGSYRITLRCSHQVSTVPLLLLESLRLLIPIPAWPSSSVRFGIASSKNSDV